MQLQRVDTRKKLKYINPLPITPNLHQKKFYNSTLKLKN